MYPVCQEGGFYTAKHGVQHHAHGQQETSRDGVHAGQIFDHGTTTCEQHGRDEDVGHDAKEDVDAVGDTAISCADGFEKRMGVRGAALEFDGQGREENHLDCCARGIPEGTADAVFVCYC